LTGRRALQTAPQDLMCLRVDTDGSVTSGDEVPPGELESVLPP